MGRLIKRIAIIWLSCMVMIVPFYSQNLVYAEGPVSQVEENLVNNGSFETYTGNNGLADEWLQEVTDGGTYAFHVESTSVASGIQAQKVTGTEIPENGRIKFYQEFDVISNKAYVVSVKVKAEALQNARFELYTDFIEADSSWINGEELIQTVETDGYVTLTASGVVPDTAVAGTVEIALKATGPNGIGTIYVDDVTFYYVVESNPPTGDIEPPTVPGNLRVTEANYSSISLAWDASTDDVGVSGYEIYSDDVLIDTTTELGYIVNDLSPTTDYTFKVNALDAAGNRSSESLIAAATTEGLNLIVNGGFETYTETGFAEYWDSGETDGAISEILLVADSVASGSRATKISGSEIPDEGQVKINQEITILPNIPFVMSAKVKVESLQNAKAQFFIDFSDVDGNFLSSNGTEHTLTTDGYITYITTGVIPATATKATVNIAILATETNGSGIINVDDVELNYDTANVASLIVPSNIVYNGGFEKKSIFGEVADEWRSYTTSWGNSEQEVVSQPVSSGASAMKITGSDISDGGRIEIYQWLEVIPNKSFYVTAEVNSEMLQDAGDHIYVDFYDENYNWISRAEVYNESVTDEYSTMILTGQVPVNAKSAELNVALRGTDTDTDGSGTIYVDDVGFYYGIDGNDEAEDVRPPTDPDILKVMWSTPTSIDLAWSASRDQVGVIGYEVYRDEILMAFTDETAFKASNLTEATTFTFTIKALDAAGNYSEGVSVNVGTDGANIIANAGFEEYTGENGLADIWDDYYDAYDAEVLYEMESLSVESGIQSQKVTVTGMTEDDYISFEQDFDVIPNKTYVMSVKVKTETLQNTQLELYTYFRDYDGYWIDGEEIIQTVETDGYVTYTISGVVPDESEEGTVEIALQGTGPDGVGTIYVDDVQFYYINSSLNLLYSQPDNNEIGVNVSSPISLAFNNNLMESMAFDQISMSSNDLETPIAAYIEGKKLRIVPTEQLNPLSTYEINIPANALKIIVDEAISNEVITLTFETGSLLQGGQTKLAAGANHTTLVKSDGTVWSWGSNSDGQLGDGTTVQRNNPVQVKGAEGIGVLSDVISVSSRDNHTLALKSDGTVWGWGYDGFGQLGDRTSTSGLTPVQIKGPKGVGILTDVIAISTGQYNSAAVKSDGTVWAWGNNDWGQLGDGTFLNSNTPTQVVDTTGSGYLQNVVSVTVGNGFMMALKSNGTVWGWGSNYNGQLGDGTYTERNTPVQVKGENDRGDLLNIIAISSGNERSMALRADGTLWNWGHNGVGQLGIGSTEFSNTPVQVLDQYGNSPMRNVKSFNGTIDHATAVLTDGVVWSWGRNTYGQLGDGTETNSSSPRQVVGLQGNGFLEDIIEVSTGSDHTVALKSDGSIRTWGLNDHGQLGNGSTVNSAIPIVANIRAFTQGIELIKSYPESDQAGINVNAQIVLTFKENITEGEAFNQIKLHSGTATIASTIMINGSILTIKPNQPLEQKQTYRVTLPTSALGYVSEEVTNEEISFSFETGNVLVAGDNKMLAAGAKHTVVLKTDGTVWNWGNNDQGQLGIGTAGADVLQPVQVKGLNGAGVLTDIVSISSREHHTLGLKSDGTVWAWGHNGYGQLGSGNYNWGYAPIQVVGPDGVGKLTDVVDISTGIFNSVALKSDGTVWTWGNNTWGQLGDGTTSSRNYPKQVKDASGNGYLIDVVSVTVSNGFMLALKSDGTVWTWGRNANGQLGDGTRTNQYTPVQVVGPDGMGKLIDIIAISSGNERSMALRSDGTLWNWGHNGVGQLGIGSNVFSNTPVQVLDQYGMNPLQYVETFNGTIDHASAGLKDGTVWSWGRNTYGQLGDGTITNSSYPKQVVGLQGNGFLEDIVEVSTGTDHTVALKSDGSIWTWGLNSTGQLGNGTTTNVIYPSEVKLKTVNKYTYDSNNRLVSLTFNKGVQVFRRSYNYDDNGNLLNAVTTAITIN